MMMTHDELKDILLWAMGGRVHPDARETWGRFLRERQTSYFLNYDWIKKQEFYQKAEKSERLDIGAGGYGLRVYIREKE